MDCSTDGRMKMIHTQIGKKLPNSAPAGPPKLNRFLFLMGHKTFFFLPYAGF